MNTVHGVYVPNEAITEGPQVQWNHIDGPLMTWTPHIHWLTWGERIRLALRLTTIDELACDRWPYMAMRRAELRDRSTEQKGK